MAMRSSSDRRHLVSTSRASPALAWNISRISAGSFGRPPGLPLSPFLNNLCLYGSPSCYIPVLRLRLPTAAASASALFSTCFFSHRSDDLMYRLDASLNRGHLASTPKSVEFAHADGRQTPLVSKALRNTATFDLYAALTASCSVSTEFLQVRNCAPFEM